MRGAVSRGGALLASRPRCLIGQSSLRRDGLRMAVTALLVASCCLRFPAPAACHSNDASRSPAPARPAASYLRSLLKAFQRAVEEGRYKFIIVDAPALRVGLPLAALARGARTPGHAPRACPCHHSAVVLGPEGPGARSSTRSAAPSCPPAPQVADFKDFWSAGQGAGYEVYVAEPPETDPQVRPPTLPVLRAGGQEGAHVPDLPDMGCTSRRPPVAQHAVHALPAGRSLPPPPPSPMPTTIAPPPFRGLSAGLL